MFLEQTKLNTQRKGWIEVVTGSMFSGKTEELIRRLKRAQIAKQQVEIFKPAIERRYDDINIVWPCEDSPSLSAKDQLAKKLADAEVFP